MIEFFTRREMKTRSPRAKGLPFTRLKELSPSAAHQALKLREEKKTEIYVALVCDETRAIREAALVVFLP